jgi:hypothetical protein
VIDVRRERAGGGRAEGAALGALAGLVGGGCMTVAHVALKRAGALDKTSPEAVAEELGRGTGRRPRAWYGAVEQLAHVVYAAGWGAVYGAIARRPRRWAATGAGFGALVWAGNFLGIVPAAGIAAGPRRAPRGQLAAALAAHLVYGVATALALSDFSTRPSPRHTSLRARSELRIG